MVETMEEKIKLLRRIIRRRTNWGAIASLILGLKRYAYYHKESRFWWVAIQFGGFVFPRDKWVRADCFIPTFSEIIDFIFETINQIPEQRVKSRFYDLKKENPQLYETCRRKFGLSD